MVKTVIKVATNPRVVSAVISAVSAVICVVCAGCKLSVGKFGIEDTSVELFPTNYIAR